MSIIGFLGIVVGALVILILLSYALVGIFSFPFFFIGLLFRVVFFPIQIIDTVFYPVGNLPYLVVFGFLAYIVFDLLFHGMKRFTSFKDK